MADSSLPPLRVGVRSKDDGVSLHGDVPTLDKIDAFSAPASVVNGPLVFSRDGRLFGVVDPGVGVLVYNAGTGALVQTIKRAKVLSIAFSPRGSFVLTWERRQTAEEGGGDGKNLIVWNVSNGKDVARWSQKNYSRDTWPTLVWSDDEVIAARMVTNEVQIYDGMSMEKGVQSKVHLEGIKQFALAPGQAPYHISCFVGERKGAPARVCLYRHPHLASATGQKSFYKAEEVSMLWNSTGKALLVKTNTAHDKTGQSYYGETNLYFMTADGKYEQIVDLPKDGPVHDVQWNPTGTDFAVCFGFMPAKTLLFNSKCEPIFDFGSLPRNTIKWNPHGRFLLLAGFGNLQGDMDVWDRNKLKKIGTARGECTVSCEWSPCGRYLLTATTFPRLRVDNGYKVWKYNGKLVLTKTLSELYQVAWRPANPGVYPNKPISPRGVREAKEMAAAAKSSTGGSGGSAAPKRGAYVPPALRGKGGQATGSVSFTYRKDEEDTGGRITRGSRMAGSSSGGGGGGGGGASGPIGSQEPEKLSKSALKNKRRREKKKAAQAAKAAAGEGGGEQPQQQQQQKQQQKKKENVDVSGPNPFADLDVAAAQKMLKKMHKKLRQIEALKMKKQAGTALTPEEAEKAGQEKKMRTDVAFLERLVL